MKKFLISFSVIFIAGMVFTSLQAQSPSSDKGKTYYDAEKTKPKEVFSFKDKIGSDPASQPQGQKMKHGPYFYYHENGKLKITGTYLNDMKSGVWKYFDEGGTLIKTEKYDNDKLIQ